MTTKSFNVPWLYSGLKVMWMLYIGDMGLGTKIESIGDARVRPVVHVTESFGGGVAAAIRDYCRNYPFAEHHLVYAPRTDAPIEASDISEFASVTRLVSGHLRRIADLRRFLRNHPDAVVHAHSSFAGAYVRAAIAKSPRRPIVYTPHCYGFERRDTGIVQRSAFWALEWMFAFNTTAFAACSQREEELSNWPLTSAKTVHVPNVVSSDIPVRDVHIPSGRIMRVVGAGRLGPQKDPMFFRDCVVALRDAGYDVEATWIGGGEPDMELMLATAGIATTGWLTRSGVLDNFKVADVYIHSAKWEGFPIAVLEASTMGVPIVARDISAFTGVDIPLLINSPDDLVRAWPELQSASVRHAMVRSVASALEHCNDVEQAKALRGLYDSRVPVTT
ncbi:glycosyltransferase [Paenarthrobacter sp. YIM B13468]|uniref:glycosyltransferase n=1 Tax=Paenarthrobacter sp. YIM B13468 TaxID=3366295 RepID=UPI00366FF993